MLLAKESLENTVKGLPEVCKKMQKRCLTSEQLGVCKREFQVAVEGTKKTRRSQLSPTPHLSHSETFLLSFKQKVHRKSSAQAQAPEEPVWFTQTGNSISNEAKGEAHKNLQGAKCPGAAAPQRPDPKPG